MNTSSREVKRHLNARRATKEVFFTNLMLLGFEPAREEAKYRVQFTSDMFKVPNKKAFEVVMHFLFKKLDPVMAKEQFRDCWPVTDKKQEQLFRKNVNNWLTHIAAEKAEANLPRIVPSMFLSPGGDKFYNLMLHFSTYVCKKAIIEEHGVKGREFLQHPKLMPSIIHLGPVMAKAERSATISQRKKFLEATQYNGILHKEWQEISHGLTKQHRALKKEIRELERRVEERWRRNQELNGKTGGSPLPMKRKTGGRFDGEMEVQAIKRAQKVQKVRGLWSSLEDFHKSHSQHREILDSVLGGLANRYKIDANDIHVQVPAMLLSECERQIQRRNVGNTYEGGKLNLLSLLHLSNLSLHLYLEKLHQTRLPRFEKMTPKIASDVHTHHAHLANMQALRSKLASEMVPELKESIDNLIAELDAEDVVFSKQTQPTDKSSDGLWLIPPTPPSVYSLEPDADIETPPHLREAWSMSGAPEMVDTPEAVAKLDERITKMAMRRAGLVQGTPVSTRKELREQLKGESKLPRPTSSVKTSMTGRQAQKGSMKIQRPDTIGGSKVEVPTKVAPQETFTTQPQTSQDQKWTPVRSKKTATPSTRYKPALSLMDEQQADPDTSSYQRHQATPSAHDILADQIASAITGDGVEDDLLAIKSHYSHLGWRLLNQRINYPGLQRHLRK
ncbi:HAUS augmin-like complex subunit 6 [Ptychodera flava]|uniref:HAUS augmin-like complex subunit 6 n=1 Tax=Ptychodera flava TaxID=63121 RepID=UPI00396A5C44